MKDHVENHINEIIQKAKTQLMEKSSIPADWYMVKDDMIHLMSHILDGSEEHNAQSEEATKLAAEWLEPNYVVQVTNVHLISPEKENFEVLAILMHLPAERPIAWLFKVNRLTNGQVVFIREWISKKYVPFGGILYSPYEKLSEKPSQRSIETVQRLLGLTKRPMLKVV